MRTPPPHDPLHTHKKAPRKKEAPESDEARAARLAMEAVAAEERQRATRAAHSVELELRARRGGARRGANAGAAGAAFESKAADCS